MNIFNIGKANERITALENELKQAKEETQKAQDALKENSKQLEQAAETLTKERDEIKGKLDAEVSAHGVTKQALEKANADLKASQALQADFDKKVEEKAGKIAADKVAASGLPRPLENKPSAGAPGDQKDDLSKLTGIEKTKAAFLAQLKKA